MTQQQLAERAGVSIAVIRDLEQGRTASPRRDSAERLARALGLRGDQLTAPAAGGRADQRRPVSVTSPLQAPGPDRAIRLNVLGPLEALRDGTPVGLGPRRQQAVLALLAVQPGRPVHRESIIDVIWSQTPPPSAVTMIQAYVSQLRGLLGTGTGTGEPGSGGLLGSSGESYLLAPAAGQLDLLEFTELAACARNAAAAGDAVGACDWYERAAALWRGAPVADVTLLRGHPAVGGLARQRAAVVLGYADAAAKAGWHDRVLEHLRALADAEPLDERAHARLMIALAATGQQAAALSTFDRLRRRLRDELGVAPGAEVADAQLRVLRGQVRDQHPGPVTARPPHPAPWPAAPPRQLPAAVAHFTGRSRELDALSVLLDQVGSGAAGTVAIAAISGMAGVGKTALAVHWAHQAAGRFPDGQLYLNLRGFDTADAPATPATAIRRFLDALGAAADRVPPTPDAQQGLYRGLLADRRMLIVLDNARDEQQVRPLLPASPGSMVLVTSRRQLAGLAACDGARLVTLGAFSHAEATQMLTGRLGSGRAAAEPGAIAEIARLCACLPLALAVTAARAAARPRVPLATLADELRGAASRLDALDAGDPAVSIRTVFSWSTRQLSLGAERMFRLLGVHPGPDISVPAAATLASLDLPGARGLLHELAHASLIAEHAPGRYAVHDLLRAYAAD